MKDKLQDIVKKIERQLPPSRYGFKKSLRGKIDKKGLSLTLKGADNSQEYDCLYYSVKGQELLRKAGVNTEVYSGQDEHNLWENHTYLKTEEGEIIDFSPLYQTIGAKHKKGRKLTQKEIMNYKQSHSINLNRMIPLYYDEKSHSLLRLGINTTSLIGTVKLRNPEKTIYFDVLKQNKLKGRYVQEGQLILHYTGKRIKGTLNNMITTGVFLVDSESKYKNKILNLEKEIDNYVSIFLSRLI